MKSSQIKTIKNIIKECRQSECGVDIIFGSGFSNGICAAGNNKVNLIYPSLITEVERLVTSKRIKSLLAKNMANENNLEYYIKLMNDSTLCIPFLNNTDYLNDTSFDENNIIKDIINLKKAIIDTIEQIHPKSWVPYGSQITYCARNLNTFRRIYTLNYDLIIYWAILKHNEIFSDTKQFVDGFSHKPRRSPNLLTYSDSNNKANILYLHGAIHLVTDLNGDTRKICKSKSNAWINLADLIHKLKNSRLLTNYQNLVVLEGTTEKKIKIISQSSYLHKCHQRLQANTCNIIIYGCSILDNEDEINNDSHIWRAVIRSSCNKIYIGIHIDPFSVDDFNDRKNKIILALENKYCIGDIKRKIEFFRTDTEDIWSADWTRDQEIITP
jgi:hypothetical protein